MKTKENENTAEQDWSRISNSMTTSHWLSIKKIQGEERPNPKLTNCKAEAQIKLSGSAEAASGDAKAPTKSCGRTTVGLK